MDVASLISMPKLARELLSDIVLHKGLSDETALQCFGRRKRLPRSRRNLAWIAARTAAPVAGITGLVAVLSGHFIAAGCIAVIGFLLVAAAAIVGPIRCVLDRLLDEQEAIRVGRIRDEVFGRVGKDGQERIQAVEREVERVRTRARDAADVVDELFGLSELITLQVQLAIAHAARTEILRNAKLEELRERLAGAEGLLDDILQCRVSSLLRLQDEVETLEAQMVAVQEAVALIADQSVPQLPDTVLIDAAYARVAA